MGIKSISLSLQGGRDIFYEGEVVSGVCQVEVAEGSEVPCVEVKFQGNAYVHWTETRTSGSGKSRTTHTVSYTASLDLFLLQQNLSTTEGKIPAGIHQIPFVFQLPRGIATSFEGVYGYVRYSLFAQAPANWFTSLFKPKAITHVKVLQWIDTNLPQYQLPVIGRDTKTVCCWCCASGPLFVDARTDRAAYCPNEILTIFANFRNNSSKRVKPYAKLVQKRLFHARGKTRTTDHSWDLFPMNQSDGTTNYVGEGGCTSWNGIQFRLPECSPSINCGIIEVNYYIEVGLDIPLAFDLEVYLPIVIGTIPFQGQPIVSQQQPMPMLGAPMDGVPSSSARAALPTDSAPWAGSGKQSGVPPHSAPVLPSPQRETCDFNVPPPSYFATIFANDTPSLPQVEDGEHAQQHQPQQEGQVSSTGQQ